MCALVLGLRLEGNRLALTLRDLSRSREWALQLRIALILLIGLSFVASETGGSTLLAGFGAGLVLARLQEPERLEVQLSGLAEGFFVPAFFVLLGSELDFRALGADPRAVFLAILMAAAAISIHVVASRVASPRSWSAYGLAAPPPLSIYRCRHRCGRLPDRPSGLDRHTPSRGGTLREGFARRRAQPCPAG